MFFGIPFFLARYLDADDKFKPALINSLSSFFKIIRFKSWFFEEKIGDNWAKSPEMIILLFDKDEAK